MRGVPHPPQVKARALALILTGSSYSAVSRATGIDRRSLRAWRCALGAVPICPPCSPLKKDAAPARVPTRADLARLADPAFLRTLSARELAQIHGGLFGGMERGGRAARDAEGEAHDG